MRKQLHYYFFLLLFVIAGKSTTAQVYDQTTAYQDITSNGQSFTFSFTGLTGVPVGQAQIHVIFEGDFGDQSEFINVTLNGNNIGHSNPTGSDCSAEEDHTIVFNANQIGIGNTVDFTFTTTQDVDQFCTLNHIRARLVYNYCVNPNMAMIADIGLSSNSVCPDGSTATLTGTPAGGTYSGTGVTGNTFNSAGLPSGYYTVSYTSTDNTGCTTSADTTIRIEHAPTATYTVACSTINGNVTANPPSQYAKWYSDIALTNNIGNGANLPITNVSADTTFYLTLMAPQYQFEADTFTVENFAIVDHDAITGDDRGGIAVTNNYVYIVGDDYTGRYNLDLTNGVQLPIRDGIFTDLATNKIYTLYNTITGTDEPYNDSWHPVFNAIRTLNDDLSLGNDSVMLDRTFDINVGGGSGMFAGAGFLILYDAGNMHCYVINIYTGKTDDLGVCNVYPYYQENWADWGIAEYDGTQYSVIYRNGNDDNVHRQILPNGADNVLSDFTDMSDMGSLVYSSSNNRWYFHFEGGSQLSGMSETLGYGDATADTTYIGLVQTCARAILVTPDTQFNFTAGVVKATGNCSGTTKLFATPPSMQGNYTYQWLANNTPITNALPYSGATTDTLYVADTTGLVGTTYSLVFTNTCGFSDTTNSYTMNHLTGNIWYGGWSTDWDDANNWDCGEVPTALTAAIISPNAYSQPIVNVPDAICASLELGYPTGVAFTGTGNQLEILGDVSGPGALIGLDGKVLLSGANQQDINFAIFGDLEVTGGGTKVFHQPSSVSNILALTNGNIEMHSSLYLVHPELQTGGGANSFVVTKDNGNIRAHGLGIGAITTPYTFHVGINDNSYTPLTLLNEGVADTFMVQVKPHVYVDGYGTNPALTQSPVVDRTWMIVENTPGGSFATITPQWNAGDEVNGFDLSHVYVAHYMNAMWTSEFDSALYAPAAMGTNPYTTMEDSITTFSPFAVASHGQFPLTITLVDISAANAGSYNKVNWNSSKENSGDKYELERSIDGKSFSRIATIAAQGKAASYNYNDNNAVKGINYYRVKMTEANGKFTYSKVVSAVVNGNATFGIEAFPNPVKNTVSIKVNGTVAGKGNVTVSDITGKVLASASVINNVADVNMSGFANGLYIINYTDDVRNETMKINKQ